MTYPNSFFLTYLRKKKDRKEEAKSVSTEFSLHKLMAQYNMAHFYGVVSAPPSVSVNKETGEKKQVTLYIYTVTSARQYDSGNEVYNAELNQIRVRTGISEIVGEMANLRMGDIIAMKGSINTKNVPKGIKCPNCGALINVAASSSKKKSILSISEPDATDSSEYALGMITFITPIDFKVIDTTYGDKISPYAAKYTTTYGPEQEEAKAKMNAIMNEAKQELLRHREMSNEIQVIGNLCADPVQWENGRVTSYQLGVNRNFFIKDDDPAVHSDFPFIRSMGMQADKDIEALKKGSLVLVDGFVRMRKFNRENVCEKCNSTKKWVDKVLEIVPYTVQYLDKYKTEKEIEEDKKTSLF